jgi:hypothetical protein
MPSMFIESLLRNMSASSLTDVFLIILLAIFSLSIFWKRKHQHANFTGYAPTLLTSVGILGTFAGIIIGLLDFDTADIDTSIGPLLEGLKTAFISSLAGMLLSILYKGIVTTGFLIPAQTEITTDEDVSSLDLYRIMQQQAESTELMRKAISGDEDSSLVSMMKLMRSDANDQYKRIDEHLKITAESVLDLSKISKAQQEEFKLFQDRLWRNLQDFADMMSKSATEQVIEALKQVIQDFNNNLIESFGDNFKQLNLAVEKLVEWQENYKVQLGEMEQQYAKGVEAIALTEASVAHISEDAKAIPATMDDLREVVEVNQHQITELDRHLEAFKDVRDKAVEAVPEIRSQIDMAISGAKEANDELAKGILASGEVFQKAIVEGATDLKDNVGQATAALSDSANATASSSEIIKDQFSDVIKDINNNLRNLIAELQQGGESLNASFREASQGLITENAAVHKSFSDGIDQMQRSLASTVEEQAQEHRRQADRVFQGLEKSIETALSDTGESVTKQVDMIDKAMEVEIEKVMQSMGSALASITGQFTSDYQKLVAQMNQVVRQQ